MTKKITESTPQYAVNPIDPNFSQIDKNKKAHRPEGGITVGLRSSDSVMTKQISATNNATLFLEEFILFEFN